MPDSDTEKQIQKDINKRLAECEEFLEVSKEILQKLNIHESKIISIKEGLESASYDANYNRNILNEFKRRRVYESDPSFNSYYNDYNSAVAGFQLTPNEIVNSFDDIEKNLNLISGIISNSSINMGTGAAVLHTYIEENNDNLIYNEINSSYPWKNPITEKDYLNLRLYNIKPNLSRTLDNIWDSLLFKCRQEENRSPAHLLREFMSDFLHTLVEEKDLLKLPWCKKTNKGNPTQRSMVLYVIKGEVNYKSEDDFENPIINIAKEYRNLYEKLNGYAHYRGESVRKNVRIKLKSFAETVQNLTREILRLRTLRLISENGRIDIGPCIDGGEVDIKITCSRCENIIAFGKIDFPAPYMRGEREIDTWKESENYDLICDKCDKEYSVFIDNSMYKAVIDFTRGTIPLYVDYDLKQKPFN